MPRKLPELKSHLPTLPPLESKYLSRVPFILGCVGPTGSGKSHLALSIVKLMRREHTITKLYVICPTVRSNTIYQAILKPTDLVFEDVSKCYDALKAIEADCQAVSEQYRNDLQYAITYKKYTDGQVITDADEHLLDMHSYMEITPLRPSPCLIIDDCSHSPLFSTSSKNPLTNCVLRSRHVGDGLGLSIVMIAQSFTSGIPRCLRQNLTHLALFRTESEREVKSMYDETNGQMSFVHFKHMFDHYTRLKHSYCFVDNIARTMSDTF
jgi:ABC-type dipeptide/oligopeptide/nickel transport system ATPase component